MRSHKYRYTRKTMIFSIIQALKVATRALSGGRVSDPVPSLRMPQKDVPRSASRASGAGGETAHIPRRETRLEAPTFTFAGPTAEATLLFSLGSRRPAPEVVSDARNACQVSGKSISFHRSLSAVARMSHYFVWRRISVNSPTSQGLRLHTKKLIWLWHPFLWQIGRGKIDRDLLCRQRQA